MRANNGIRTGSRVTPRGLSCQTSEKRITHGRNHRIRNLIMDAFIGIDVGAGSARAGIFDSNGKCLATAVNAIKMWTPQADYTEQSSDDIWAAVCQYVQSILKDSGVEKNRVKGIGFDATCSLVAMDENDGPVTVSPSGKDGQNITLWMDHRAIEQAERINTTKHPVLDYVGVTISPKMETPKLLWLKEHMSASWQRAAQFFDLPDYLTYRAPRLKRPRGAA